MKKRFYDKLEDNLVSCILSFLKRVFFSFFFFVARNLAYESTNGESPLSQIMRVHAAHSLTHVAVSFNSEGVRLPLFFSEQPVSAFPALVLLNSLLVSRTFAKCQQLLPFSSLRTL